MLFLKFLRICCQVPDFLQRLIALIFIILFSPIFFLLALIIFLDDGIPIVFKQKRVGKNGDFFNCLKFRTMLKNSESILQNDKKLMKIYIENDYKIPEELETRYTKHGLFFRKYSLDEIPQFINVLNGDMNLVGPRPIVPNELEHYTGEKRKFFLSVKPGITGLWQVSGRSNIDYPDRVDFELEYVNKRSFFFDIKILFKTVFAVLARRGAH